MYWWWNPEWCNGSAYHSSRYANDSVEPENSDASGSPVGISADRRLVLLVARALLDDPAVTGGRVEVNVQNGVVILDGDIDTEAALSATVQRVWSVPGVLDVCNALHVSGSAEE